MRPLSAIVVLFALACSERRPAPPAPVPVAAPQTLPQGKVIFETARGEVPIHVEVADTDERRAQGLMYRRVLAAEQGMLFIFPSEELQSFWMHNTYLPLDIIFVNSRLEVVGVVENATPLTEAPRMVRTPSRFVVEVNAHLARVNGIRAGTKVRFEGVQSPLLKP